MWGDSRQALNQMIQGRDQADNKSREGYFEEGKYS